jgi:hypothetical protein
LYPHWVMNSAACRTAEFVLGLGVVVLRSFAFTSRGAANRCPVLSLSAL